MVRVVLALCVLMSSADAGPIPMKPPSSAPELDPAAKLWSAAWAEKDPAKASAAWAATAAAYMQVFDAGTAHVDVRKGAVYAAVLAWKKAIDLEAQIARATPVPNEDFDRIPTPRPLDARDQALLRTLDAYLSSSPTHDEQATTKFMRANVLRRRDQLDKAITTYLEILEHYRDHEVAQYAANLVLDAYNRLQRYEELTALAAKLHADKTFLANKPDLAEAVGRIVRIQAQQVARAEEQRATETGDLAYFDRCGERYVALLEDPAIASNEAEEARYNAAVCFQRAGSVARAVALYREIIKLRPRSSLAGRSMARLGVAEANVAHYREALESLEKYSKMYTGEKDAVDAASDALVYALALGDLVRAGTLAGYITKSFARKQPRRVIELNLLLIEAQLAAGKRSDATPRAKGFASSSWGAARLVPPVAYRAGRTMADAACTIELVDELCPRPRDKRVVMSAREMLADAQKKPAPGSMFAGDHGAVVDHARHIELDLDLEGVLATRAGADAVMTGYMQLIGTTQRAEIRIAGHARLGALHRHLGDREQALRALRECVREARATMLGSEWLARCERDLTALREPDPDLVPERLARPRAGAVIELELPRQGTAQVPR